MNHHSYRAWIGSRFVSVRSCVGSKGSRNERRRDLLVRLNLFFFSPFCLNSLCWNISVLVMVASDGDTKTWLDFAFRHSFGDGLAVIWPNLAWMEWSKGKKERLDSSSRQDDNRQPTYDVRNLDGMWCFFCKIKIHFWTAMNGAGASQLANPIQAPREWEEGLFENDSTKLNYKGN